MSKNERYEFPPCDCCGEPGLVSVAGIEPEAVLLALYHGTRSVGVGRIHDNPRYSLSDAARDYAYAARRDAYLKGAVRFDYVAGRPIKVTFTANAHIEDVHIYDETAGRGAARRVVASLRPS